MAELDDNWGPTLLGGPTASGDDSGRLCLVVIGEGAVASFPLPETGTITIGRSGDNDVRVEDPLVSRNHARFHMGAKLMVEDLGSANGSRLSNEPLPPNELQDIVPGLVVEVGTTMLIVQHATSAQRRRRLWTHGYFEMRLEDECNRWQNKKTEGDSDATFAILRLHIEGTASEQVIQETLTSVLGAGDVVASYGPGEYELLMMQTSKSRAEMVAENIASRFEEEGLEVEAGVACFPGDGRTPDAMQLAAAQAMRGTETVAEPAEDIVVTDPAMRDLYRVAERIAQGKISVLLLGETGVGKEVFAETVHRLSPRRDKPYVRINCAALSESLLESELFGYEKGAFTGADRAKPGLLETGDGGTVFMDELGEMPLELQAKLLRVVEQSQVLRVGGLKPRTIDVRYVAATNRDIDAEVAAGRFRQDLFYRLNGVTLMIPPLRERTAEIEGLANMFLKRVWAQMALPGTPELSPRALTMLQGYRWPGNIRELRNIVERAALLCTGEVIEPEHLPLEKMTATWDSAPSKPSGAMRAASNTSGVGIPAADPSLSDADLDERQRIIAALERCGGNQTRAARELGISRRTLSTRLNKYNIPRPRKGPGY